MMNKLLQWVAVITFAVVVWLMASTVMFGLFLFVPLAVLIWGVLTPVQPPTPEPALADTKELNDKFWALVYWNERHGDV